VLLLLLSVGSGGDLAPPAFSKPAPGGVEDIREMEAALTRLAEQAIASTVGIQVGSNHGSGVVISEDGYVLTAAHVADRPGRDAIIRFRDGTEVSGKTLGMNIEADGALIKITDEGVRAFAPLVSLEDYPKPGDWCMATGHPGGFDDKRSPPVRLGRVIDVNKYVLRTDCAINSGDSGGPLFDMQGRVIGIHSRIAEEATVNLHGPVLEFLESWQQMKSGGVYPPLPTSRFLARLDVDRDGQITRAELKDETAQRVYDRLVQKFSLDADKSYPLNELRDRFGWRDAPVSLEIRDYEPNNQPGQMLPDSRFVRGEDVRAAFKPLADSLAQSIVEVLCDGERVALGTVVAEGILTKASELKGDVVCKTHDGRELAARLVHMDKQHDVALLKTEASDLVPVAWAEAAELRTGSWLITVGPRRQPISVGVISVAERQVEGMPPVIGVEIGPHDSGALVVGVVPGGGAAQAGLKENDVIVELMGQPVNNIDELKAVIQQFQPGDTIQAIVLRGDERSEFSIRLRTFDDVFSPNERFGSGRLNGKLNERRDRFPLAVQHDSVMQPHDCGGPVLDSTGRVVGINIARADRIASYALTSSEVQKVLTGFQSSSEEPTK